MNTQAKTAPTPHASLLSRLILRAGFRDETDFVLRVVQPALVGMIDGTVSSLAPIFAAAISSNSHTALLVGFATALGAGVSMAGRRRCLTPASRPAAALRSSAEPSPAG